MIRSAVSKAPTCRPGMPLTRSRHPVQHPALPPIPSPCGCHPAANARRWCLRYTLSYEHVTELVAERRVEVDASCMWRSAGICTRAEQTQPTASKADDQELSDLDETYMNVKGEDNAAGFRDSEHDPEGPSEMAGQRRCVRPISLLRRAVRDSCLTQTGVCWLEAGIEIMKILV